ncbi:MAG: DNA-formamidopyrimidine glycosylase [Anaerolineae bacterium]|nr:DNA-formamidopyrimidine glycosylase [Anaerolineae bacterium]
MPEGPEVQTIVNGLRALITGLTIEDVSFFDDAARMVSPASADELTHALRGQAVVAVGRRGKFIDIALDSGMHLLIHLMMTGRLLFRDEAYNIARPRFLRCAIAFAGGAELCLGDQRKWAMILYLPAAQIDADSRFRKLGVDVLGDDFTYDRFRALLTSRRNLHAFLLDQARLSGLGNIYVNEALFQAGLHPLRAANTLSDAEAMALYYAIYHVVREAVRQLGTSFSDYWMPDGTRGEFQNFLYVFQRAGAPCLRCGAPIERIGMAGRGAFFCPQDQPLAPPARPPAPPPADPDALLPNHIFILKGPEAQPCAALAAHIAAHVPFTQVVETAAADRLAAALRGGSDALLCVPDALAAAVVAQHPNAHALALEAHAPEAALHEAFDAIYAVRCQTPHQHRDAAPAV